MAYYMDEARIMWFWLTDEEIIERIESMLASGKLVKATDEEIDVIKRGEWRRVGTHTVCSICNKSYVDHPLLDYDTDLHRLCNGILGKT